MTSAPIKVVGKSVAKRVTGDKPAPPQAFVAALVVGLAAAVLTYKALRSG